MSHSPSRGFLGISWAAPHPIATTSQRMALAGRRAAALPVADGPRVDLTAARISASTLRRLAAIRWFRVGQSTRPRSSRPSSFVIQVHHGRGLLRACPNRRPQSCRKWLWGPPGRRAGEPAARGRGGERRRLVRRQLVTVRGTTLLAAALITIGTSPQARGTLNKIADEQQRCNCPSAAAGVRSP